MGLSVAKEVGNYLERVLDHLECLEGVVGLALSHHNHVLNVIQLENLFKDVLEPSREISLNKTLIVVVTKN